MPSFTPPNAVPYRSAAQTDARPANSPARKYPLPPECPNQFAGYAFSQEFEQKLSSFPPAPRNTISTNSAFGNLGDANAILTSLSQPVPTGAGMGRYTAEFNIVPASWDDFKMLNFTFNGFAGYWLLPTGSTVLPGRNAFTENILARQHYDYFLVDPSAIASGITDSAGGSVTVVNSLSAIPIIPRSVFSVALNAFNTSILSAHIHADLLSDHGGTPIDGTIFLETLPNKQYYQKWIDNAVANGWSSSVWDGVSGLGYTAGTASTVGQFVAQESQLQPYAGNIIARVTTYLLAK